jgi:hypothetical protein
VSPAFAARPLKSAEILGPHTDKAVVFYDLGEFVFAEHVSPDVRQQPPKPGAPGDGEPPWF